MKEEVELISEEENDLFWEEMERELERLIEESGEKLKPRGLVQYENAPENNSELIADILRDFNEKAAEPSGITCYILSNTHQNIYVMLGEIFTVYLAMGYYSLKV